MYDGHVESAGPGLPFEQLSCSSHDWYHHRCLLVPASHASYCERIDGEPRDSIDSTIGTMMSTRSSMSFAVAFVMSVVSSVMSDGALARMKSALLCVVDHEQPLGGSSQ